MRCMAHLVIEYLTEGKQRGYHFTSSTQGFSDTTLKFIWRTAMPRGQGWGAYIGARSLKCFPLDDGRLAISEVIVTDMADESGRRGIRRATIRVMNIDTCQAYLQQWLDNYPLDIRSNKPNFFQQGQIINRALPKLNGKPAQVILSRSYTTLRDWQVMEALVIKLAIAPIGPMKGWGKIVPFTTLALDNREESRLVGLPLKHAVQIRDIQPVEIR